ncbi:DUF222 domain-containing protein [Arthrobacter sp. zg-ZUI100]|uniref:HNH endonuclease signature motif containing protein n=1 Tax=Arthrobacter jiangjiafuii TaxID=2817475 RepID=UPI001AEDDAA2|nr:HNH endonuclease signature motif containing protein [Arthrobacter jiangjiafuii]MBP3036928.1 DUF222 domain-containing protein [Arthrobacter jiangjiafuii]
MDTTTTFGQRINPPPDAAWRDGFQGWDPVWDTQPPDPDWPPDPQPPDPCWPPGSIPFDPLWASGSRSIPLEEDGGGCGGARAGCAASECITFRTSPRGPVATLQAPEGALLKGFTGSLGLRGASALDQELTGAALQDLRLLEGWAAAAKVRLVHRQHLLMIDELDRFDRQRDAEEAERRAASNAGRDKPDGGETDGGTASGPGPGPAVRSRAGAGSRFRGADRSLAFSLTATEIATLFRIPEGTAMALVEEADDLCIRCPETLHQLETGAITLAQARTILDQTRTLVNPEPVAGAASGDAGDSGDGAEPENDPDDAGQLKDQSDDEAALLFPPGAAAALEQELLTLAPELTNAQLTRKARRLRERSFPQSIPVRHRTAFEQRRVWFQPKPDGMGHLTACLPAAQGQQIYGALTGAARGEQAQGDPRGLDQLRTDILASLLLHTPEPWIGAAPGSGVHSGIGAHAGTGAHSGNDREGAGGDSEDIGSGDTDSDDGEDLPPLPPGTVAEIMVLINADTLFGADDAPAELAGYGPIAAEAARRLARTALRWTGLVQDRATGHILGVGRRRKVPAGLRRWLQARDQTCRFPGCSTGTSRAEADHTIPWAAGGPTEHWNLANLCKKHHLFKTLGHWKARQVSPGVLEWISPLGRHYSTQPELTLSPRDRTADHPAAGSRPSVGRVPLATVFSREDTGSGKDQDNPAPF